MTDTLDVPMMAAEIGITPHSVRRWILARKLHATTLPKGREQQLYVVRRSVWEAFKQQRQARRNGDKTVPEKVEPRRPSQNFISFTSSDPQDRYVQQAALMKRALNGCRASREALREEPYRLLYWLAVDGPQ